VGGPTRVAEAHSDTTHNAFKVMMTINLVIRTPQLSVLLRKYVVPGWMTHYKKGIYGRFLKPSRKKKLQMVFLKPPVKNLLWMV